MFTQKSEQKTLSGIRAVAPVPRKQTMAGGFEVDLAKFPPKQSGQSGSSVVPEVSEDPVGDASKLTLELIQELAGIAQDFRDSRFVVADERLRAALMRVDGVRRYATRLALAQCVPFRCPRCKSSVTDDRTGSSFCPTCVSATYGKVRF